MDAEPYDGRRRLNVGQSPAPFLRGDPDRRAAVAAARDDRDVLVGHSADAERVDRAHRSKSASVQCDPVAGVAVGEGIRADNHVAIEYDEVATAELFEQRTDGFLAQPRTLGKRAWGRGSPVFGVEL